MASITMKQIDGLNASESPFRALFEHSTDAMLLLDNGFFVDCNPSTLRMMGATREEIVHVPFERLSPEFQPDGRNSLEKAAEMIKLAFEKGSHLFDWVHRKPNGADIYLEVSITAVPFEGRQILFTVWRDITGRKRLEEEIKQSEEQYRQLFDSQQDGVFVIQDTKVAFANLAFTKMLGYSVDELMGMPMTHFVAPEDHQQVIENYRRRMSGEEITEEYTLHLLHKDGETRVPGNMRVRIIEFRGHKASLGTIRDMSEKLRAEEALRQSQQQLRAVIANMPQVFFMVDTNGIFVLSEGRGLADLGLQPGQVVGLPVDVVYKDVPAVLADVHRALSGEEFQTVVQVGPMWFETIYTSLRNERGEQTATMGLSTNITERRRYEKELQDSVTRRGYQIQLSTEIAQEIAAAPALDELFNRVVVLVKERLGYYHTQLLRSEPALNAVVLVKGYGEVGQVMLEAGHRVEMGRGLIGSAAATGQSVLRSDISSDPTWRANPLLSETCGEMAIPIKYGDRILGVLDVQSNQVGALTDEDRLLLEGLCGQIAIAIEGTRLREEMQGRLNELNLLYRQTSHEGWESFRTTEALPTGYVFNRVDVQPMEVWVEEIEQAVMKQSLVAAQEPDSATVAPLEVRGEVIGALGVYDDPQNRLTPEELSLIEQVSDQVAVALENARLFEQTRAALNEAETLYDFSRQLSEAKTLEDIVGSVIMAAGIPQINRGNLVTFAYSPSGELINAEVRAVWYSGEGSPPTSSVGMHYDQKLVKGMLSRFQTHEPHFISRSSPESQARGVFSLIAMPLWVGSRQIGAILLDTSTKHEFTEEEKRPIASLAQQAAIAIESRLLFEETVQSENRFRNTSEQLSQALDAARMANWEFDLTKGIFIFNDTFYKFLGTSVEAEGGYEMPAHIYAQKYVHPDDGPLVGAATQRVMESTDPNLIVETNARQILQDGSIREVLIRFKGQRDDQGRVIRLLGANQDVTEQRRVSEQIESQRRTLQAVLDNMPAGVFMVEAPSGRPILSNKRAEEFLGRGISPNATGDELNQVYQAFRFGTDDLYPADQIPVVAGMFGRALNINDMEVRRPDGSRVLLEVNGTPIFNANGEIIASLVMFQDISERHKAQETIAKRAVELATVAEVSTRVATIQSPDEMLQTVVDLTRQAFGLYHAHIYQYDDSTNLLFLSNGAGEIGRRMVSEGRKIRLDAEKSLVARAARQRQGVIVNDVRQDPDFLSHPLLPNTRSEMAVPMIVGESVLGVIDIQSDEPGRFSPEDVNIMTTLAAQVAVSLQNARSFARAQRQAEREALINAISERIQSTNSIEGALQVAVREIGRALGAQHTAIRLGLERRANEDENR